MIRRMTAKYLGCCEACDEPVRPGDLVFTDENEDKYIHNGCVDPAESECECDTSMIDFDEARNLYNAAERDWEYYDASTAFLNFAYWIRDNFIDLLNLAEHTAEHAQKGTKLSPADAARALANDYYCGGTPEGDRIAAAFEKFADYLDQSIQGRTE